MDRLLLQVWIVKQLTQGIAGALQDDRGGVMAMLGRDYIRRHCALVRCGHFGQIRNT